MKTIAVQPLTQESFAPFGDVLDAHTTGEYIVINDGDTHRFDRLSDVQNSKSAGTSHVSLSIFKGVQQCTPERVFKLFEKHPLGSQAFIPLDNQAFVIIVAGHDAQGDVDENDIHAFLTRPGQSINYYANTWHHSLLCLETPSHFMIVDRTQEQDCVADENLDLYVVKEPFSLSHSHSGIRDTSL